MNWADYFDYDDGNLIWKVNLGRKIKAGAIAGTVTPRGYIIITLSGQKYLAHRIVWEMLKGPIPPNHEIDHGDGVRYNNRVGNLTLTTNVGNHKNMAKRKDNTSGTTGVYFVKLTGKWFASIKTGGKTEHLGTFSNEGDAIAARKAAEARLGFSLRHGT